MATVINTVNCTFRFAKHSFCVLSYLVLRTIQEVKSANSVFIKLSLRASAHHGLVIASGFGEPTSQTVNFTSVSQLLLRQPLR